VAPPQGSRRDFENKFADRPACLGVALPLLQYPLYQAIPFDEPVITLQGGQFCPTSQPEWSAYRDPSFGHGKSPPFPSNAFHTLCLRCPAQTAACAQLSAAEPALRLLYTQHALLLAGMLEVLNATHATWAWHRNGATGAEVGAACLPALMRSMHCTQCADALLSGWPAASV
jgi:hypothetical protein